MIKVQIKTFDDTNSFNNVGGKVENDVDFLLREFLINGEEGLVNFCNLDLKVQNKLKRELRGTNCLDRVEEI